MCSTANDLPVGGWPIHSPAGRKLTVRVVLIGADGDRDGDDSALSAGTLGSTAVGHATLSASERLPAGAYLVSLTYWRGPNRYTVRRRLTVR